MVRSHGPGATMTLTGTFGQVFGAPPRWNNARVQSLLLPRSRFRSTTSAKAWARRNDFKAPKVDTTASFYRIRQFPPSRCVPGRVRTDVWGKGHRAVVCDVR